MADRLAGAEADARRTESGIPVERVYDASSVADLGLEQRLGEPGAYPFTRGVHATMYRERPWTMRQYAGFATAEETNARFRYLLAAGAPGLSVAFDLPTQLGMDSDDPRALGEVGRVGVAIDSVEDMARLFRDIPLDRVSTSMTINAPAAPLLLLYQLVGEEQGVGPAALRGTIQNDVLKEYVARGNYIFPAAPSMRLTADTFAYCRPSCRASTRSRSAATTSARPARPRSRSSPSPWPTAWPTCAARWPPGLAVDEFAPRLSFFFNAHSDFLEEVAKFRAARRLWARIMRERFAAREERSAMLRFHAQTGGSTLTAQQPENNIVRVALQVLSAALGGAQSIHSNGYDEALALPTEESARLALRTQQVIAAETGITDTVDPLGGGWFIERLTAELEERAEALIDEIEARGGAVECIGFMREAIEESALRYHREVASGERVVIGLNAQVDAEGAAVPLQRIDPATEAGQVERLEALRAGRDQALVERLLDDVRAAARDGRNLLPPMREALRARGTVGEVCGVLRAEWGEYDRMPTGSG